MSIEDLREPRPAEIVGRCRTYELAVSHLGAVFPTMSAADVDAVWAQECQRRAAEAEAHDREIDLMPDSNDRLIDRPEFVLEKLQQVIAELAIRDEAFAVMINTIEAAAMRLKADDIDGAAALLAHAQAAFRNGPVIH